MAAGHSFGELVALHAAGVYSAEALAELSEARGRFLKEAIGAAADPGAMAAIPAGLERVRQLLEGIEGILPVNWNGPSQTVVSGPTAAVDQALERARQQGLRGQRLLVPCAFHSPLVAGASAPLSDLAARLDVHVPNRNVFSNVDAGPYPSDPQAIAARLGEHLAQPVRFATMVEALHDAGARIFVEVGPGSTLTALTDSILGQRPHWSLACDPSGRRGLPGLLSTLGRLFVAGLPLRLEQLTADRSPRPLDPVRFTPPPEVEPLTPSSWLVDGARARPAFGPEPPQFGPGPALPVPAATTARPSEPPSHFHDWPQIPHRNGHAAPSRVAFPALPPAPAANDRVLEAFQKTMQTFLDVQRTTMLGYLGHSGAAENPPELHQTRPVVPDFPASQPAERRVPRDPSSDPVPRVPPPSDPSPASRNGQGAGSVETLSAKLLDIVRERTGYPAEMLGLNMDLEADLGIDSIKRVEILGSLREALPDSAPGFDSDLMDQLARARTLGAIVARIEQVIGERRSKASEPRVAAQAPGVVSFESNGHPNDGEVRRLTLEVVEAPLLRATRSTGLVPGGVVLVSDDGRGIARAVASDLRSKGWPVVRVAHGDLRGRTCETDCEWTDLTSPAAVATLLDRVRDRGLLAGIVHALPLHEAAVAGLDPVAWACRMGSEVRGLFLMARAAADDLARAADHGGSALIAATAMGGAFASDDAVLSDFFPGQGAVAGLVKTLAREWPKVRARVVDLNPHDDPLVLAANLVQELFMSDRLSEVGYDHRRRVALRVVESNLPDRSELGIELRAGEPVIVTGGARGITARINLDLAQRWRPTLLIVGTSPVPVESDEPDVAGVDHPAELKAILHRRSSRQGQPWGPADLERQYQALRRRREIRENLHLLRDAGATVDYAQADVRDAATMRALIERWRSQFGRIGGLIHGAGVIQDKLLRDKTPESFDHVLGTKVEGALTLARIFDSDPPRFAAFFSSVAGRFGNKGQADYAAANEALNKLAVWLDRRWPSRVVSLIWGPWSGVGMVSDLEAHLGRRGLGMIHPTLGASKLAEELARGIKGDVEVIVAGDLGSLAESGAEPQAEVLEVFG
jgi:malonyl CoA-acyl carrier protein transacylase